ncbi:MAG TPA: tetratricopeptide repeat protein [Vicinamibacterales bacterium]|jgi:cytochrome c-type biogenesis protein CcmH/NrfG
MTRDAIVVGISGTFFGLIVGWILGSQMAAPAPASPAAVTTTAAPPSEPPPPPIDTARAADLERRAKAQPGDAAVRVELADIYYDARRFDLAIPWYEAALAIDGKNINASTDLAICYYYTNELDRALAQIDRSLAVDPRHVKSLLNQGIIRYGKDDLKGAAESWEKVVSIAPGSDEARMARQGLDGLKSGHARGRGAGGRP